MTTTTLSQAYTIGDTEMYVADGSSFAESGCVILSDGTHTATVSYGSVKDNELGDCVFSHGDEIVYPVGATISSTKTPYFAELKAFYDRTGITLEQKADLMLQELGLTDDVVKWCDAVPVVEGDDTQGRNWTNPDTQEVVFLDYQTYGIPADAYLEKYSVDFIGPMNRWYYEQ